MPRDINLLLSYIDSGPGTPELKATIKFFVLFREERLKNPSLPYYPRGAIFFHKIRPREKDGQSEPWEYFRIPLSAEDKKREEEIRATWVTSSRVNEPAICPNCGRVH